MKIGIDISQIVYEGSGVARYVRKLVSEIIHTDSTNEYILFGSSFRQRNKFYQYINTLGASNHNVRLVVIPIPPTILVVLWNILHIIPVEWFVGNVDVFWSSDWTQPPLARARGITTVHDLIAWKYPTETHARTSFVLSSFQLNANIVETQKRRMYWAKRHCDMFLCDSTATRNDLVKILGIDTAKTRIVYPGFSL